MCLVIGFPQVVRGWLTNDCSGRSAVSYNAYLPLLLKTETILCFTSCSAASCVGL